MSINDKSNNKNLGEFLLKPIHIILINKKMPKGFKLELEENMTKALEIIKPSAVKKQKINV